jgi:hypothetical protein
MIKFFRRIRQRLVNENRFSKYLLYAIGEIVLVVIGILIALQINNWNEDQKNKREAVTMLQNLKAELQGDMLMMDSTIEDLERRKECARSLRTFLQSRRMTEDNRALTDCFIWTGYIFKFAPSFAVYSEIQNSGRLGLIRSDSLKKQMARYRSQVQENERIEGPYEVALKEFERMAINYMTDTPHSDEIRLFKQYSLNEERLPELFEDRELYELLTHIHYFTKVEISLKRNFLIPRMESLLETIDEELQL